MDDGDQRRSDLRIAFWVCFIAVLYLSASPKTFSSRGPIHGPGFFYEYRDDPVMLLIGGAVVVVIALIGLKI